MDKFIKISKLFFGILDKLFVISEATSSICTAIEAVFLHGIKSSFFSRTLQIISDEMDLLPTRNFWSPLLIFLHKETIVQVSAICISKSLNC